MLRDLNKSRPYRCWPAFPNRSGRAALHLGGLDESRQDSAQKHKGLGSPNVVTALADRGRIPAGLVFLALRSSLLLGAFKGMRSLLYFPSSTSGPEVSLWGRMLRRWLWVRSVRLGSYFVHLLLERALATNSLIDSRELHRIVVEPTAEQASSVDCNCWGSRTTTPTRKIL